MTLKRIVQQANETKTVSIPASICDLVGIRKGDVLRFRLKNRKIIITKEPKPSNK